MNPDGSLPDLDAQHDYQRLKQILCDLADLPASERVAAARERVPDDPALLERIQSMLAGLQDQESFLEEDLPGMVGFEALTDDSGADRESGDDRVPGASIGHFRILERLGEGGMAVVYRARQTEPIEREVALKVISTHATTLQRARFERECNTLARFAHPNVAVMYESGVSPAGEPYVAMELVHGLPISDWCRQHRASVEQRIHLFIEVCQGLTHAHGKGILHRDIKPSNLLVAEVDGQPMVKVIDFGIAAALTPGIDRLSNLTGQHLIGTPAYMSPESVHVVDRQALDARSDVYSLGVVLFELLCGKRPYDYYDLPLAEWVRCLATQDAPHISQVFRRLPDAERDAIAQSASTGPNRLARQLDSDLDAIVGKALALEPEHRYGSSAEIAEDLRRYLRGSAVRAHPPSRMYLAGKFLRRNWLGAAFLALMILTLAGGIIAREMEVRQTRLALEESNAISNFLVDLLEHASPLRLEGEDVLLQDIIDRGSEQLSERFADQPKVHARMLHTLGRIYGERGDYPYGSKLLNDALELMRAEGMENSEEMVRLLSDLGVSLRRQGRLDETQTVLLEGLAKAKQLRPAQPLLEADLENSLGNLYMITEDFERAEAHHSRALQIRQANLPAGDLEITSSKNNLASVLINTWQLDRARPYAEEVLAEWQQELPAGHPWIGIARNNLAIVLERLGRKQESLQLLMDALADAEQRLGPDHPDVGDLWRNISVSLGEVGRYEESIEAMQRHVTIIAAALGADSPRALAAERRLITLKLFDKDYQAALEELNGLHDRLLAGEMNSSLQNLIDFDRVRALVGLERYPEAMVILDGMDNPQGPNYYRQRRYEAVVRGRMGDPQQAVEELAALYQLAVRDLPPQDANLGNLMESLSRMCVAAERYPEAIEWAEQAIGFWQPRHRIITSLLARQLLAEAYIAAAEPGPARQQLQQSIDGLRQYLPAQHPHILKAESLLASLAP